LPRLYLNYAVRHSYVASDRYDSTSTMSWVRSHGLSAQLVVRSHWLYFTYAMRPVARSLCSTCSLVALALPRLRRASGRMVSCSACCPVTLACLRHASWLLILQSHRLRFDNTNSSSTTSATRLD
jgi:hypothetical protein